MPTENQTYSDILKVADSYLEESVRYAAQLVPVFADGYQEKNQQFLKAFSSANLALKQARALPEHVSLGSDELSQNIQTVTRRHDATVFFIEALCAYYRDQDRTKAVKNIEASKLLETSLLSNERVLSFEYQVYDSLGQKEKMIETVNALLKLDPDNLEVKKLKFETENLSEKSAKLAAFRGSWGILITLAVVGVIGMLMLPSSAGSGFFGMLIGFGGALWYWKGKTT